MFPQGTTVFRDMSSKRDVLLVQEENKTDMTNM
jgi:hypothetical protein